MKTELNEREQNITQQNNDTVTSAQYTYQAEATATVSSDSEQTSATPTYEQMVQRDHELIDSLTALLNSRSPYAEPEPPPAPVQKPPPVEENAAAKFCFGMVRKGVGVVSLGLILIFMSIVMLACLFSAEPDYLLPLKLSPVCAVLIGIELLLHYLTSGTRFRVHVPCLCISAALVVGCCFMATSLDRSYRESKEEYTNRTISAQLYDTSYQNLQYITEIERLTIEADINPDGDTVKNGIKGLSYDDYITVSAVLKGSFSSPLDFAEECKKIINCYMVLEIPVTEYYFVFDSRLARFSLEVKDRFMQDLTAEELGTKVNYIYVEDYDYIEDLDDFIEPTDEATEEAA